MLDKIQLLTKKIEIIEKKVFCRNNIKKSEK